LFVASHVDFALSTIKTLGTLFFNFQNSQPRPGYHGAEDPRTDVIITDIVNGIVQYVDFTFPTIKEDATEERSTVMQAQQDKLDFYEANYDCEGAEVIPAVIDSHGRWGEDLKNLVCQLLAKRGSENDRQYSKVVHRLRLIIATVHAKVTWETDGCFPRTSVLMSEE
jgi:hypothetical protein